MADELDEEVLDLLWGMWRELGVPGTVRVANSGIIDPEALLVYTPALSGGDARLDELSYCWAAEHHTWVNTRRLRSVAERADDAVEVAFRVWAAPLAARTKWLDAGGPERPVTRSIALNLGRPSLAWLRARGVFGVGARADVVCAMLSEPSRWFSASDLEEVGTTRRQVARILADFAQVSLADEEPTGRARTFRLGAPGLLAALIGAENAWWPAWSAIFRIVQIVRKIEDHVDDEAPLRRVRTSKLVGRLAPWVAIAHWTVPPGDPNAPGEVVRWCVRELRRLRLASSTTLDSEWFEEQRNRAGALLQPYRPAATMELRAALERGVAATPRMLLESMSESQIETFGWPVGAVIHRPEFEPRVVEDGIRCVIALDGSRGFNGRASLDTWSCGTNGNFYLLKTLFEDQRDKGAIFYTTRIIRVAESLMRIGGFYRGLGVADREIVRLRVSHEGIQGRRLRAPRVALSSRGPARADRSAFELVTTVSALLEDTASLVRQILQPMFLLFDLQEFESTVYEEIVGKYREGIVS